MQDFTDFWKEEELSSGETKKLELAQDKYNRMWLGMEESASGTVMIPEEEIPAGFNEHTPEDKSSPGKEESASWVFNPDFDDDESRMQDFFRYVAKNVSNVPPHKYLLRYLLGYFRIYIGENNYKGLWEHVEKPKWRVSSTVRNMADLEALRKKLPEKEPGKKDVVPELSDKEYKLVISILCGRLEKCYNGLVKGNWTTYFRTLIKEPNEEKLRQLALVLNWDWDVYSLFKAKVLKKRMLNLLDRNEILLLISLKYANTCGLSPLEAYNRLQTLYPAQEAAAGAADIRGASTDTAGSQETAATKTAGNEDDNSQRIGEELEKILGISRGLNPALRNTLFTETDADIMRVINDSANMKSRRVMRSPQQVFIEQWELFSEIMSNTKNALGYGEQNRHDLFKELYGRNVEKQISTSKGNRIIDLPDDKMIRLAPEGVSDFFLDSQEFLDTRIRDNDFYAATFTTNEVRQRNLLLTMAFLNYVLQGRVERMADEDEKWLSVKKSSTVSYHRKLAEFSFNTTDLLISCGFMSLQSVSAYDSFLKLLLSCDDPLLLFQFVWSKKTDSYRHG